MKRLVLYLLLIICGITSQAQPPKIKALEERWDQIQYLKYHQPDSTKKLILKSIKEADQKKQPIWKARFYMELSRVYYENNQIDSAVFYNEASTKINKHFKNKYELAMNTFLKGFYLRIKTDLVEATKYYLLAIDEAEKCGNMLAGNYALRGLAYIYIDQRNEVLALDYALKAIALAEGESDQLAVAFSEGVLAEVYRIFEQYDKADHYFQKAYSYFNKVNNPYGKAYILTNWSIMYESDLIKNMKMIEDALEILNRIAPNSGLFMANTYNLGYGYYDLYEMWPKINENFQKYSRKELLNMAETHFHKTLEIALKMKNKHWEMLSNNMLSYMAYERGDYKTAIHMTRRHFQLKDSIYSQTNKNKIAALENQKALLEKDREISLQELKIEQKEKEKWYFTGGLILLSIIGGMLWYQNQTRKRKNEALRKLNLELDKANKTKARFFSILNHDLRAPVSQLIQFIQLQQDAPDLMDETLKLQMQQKTLRGAEHLLSTMEQLLLWSKSQMERFEPKFENVALASLFEEIRQTASQHPEIQFELELKSPETIYTDPDYLKTILRNLNSNAIKALQKQTGAAIVWKSHSDESGVHISITDNGPGGDQNSFKALFDEQAVIGTKTGLGMHLIRDLTKAIKGNITLDTKQGKGTSITLHFKT